MLYGGASGSGNHQDLYKTAVIDTMVAEVQSVPGEDRCVLLLGYKSEMENMFQVGIDNYLSCKEVKQLCARMLTQAYPDASLSRMPSISTISQIRN